MNKQYSEGKFIPAVGKEVNFQASEEIGKKTIRRFAQTIGDRNTLYSDEKHTGKGRQRGVIAPPTLIFELGYDLGEDIDEETGLQLGLERYLGHPKNIQRLGNEYEILEAVHPDDIVTVTRKIIEVSEKEGKSGKWIFLTSEIRYTNQRGKLLGINKEMLACRY
jgi:hypothetical protein